MFIELLAERYPSDGGDWSGGGIQFDPLLFDIAWYIVKAIAYFIWVVSHNPLMYAFMYFIPIMLILYGVKRWRRTK